jgi:hypothetical protein
MDRNANAQAMASPQKVTLNIFLNIKKQIPRDNLKKSGLSFISHYL